MLRGKLLKKHPLFLLKLIQNLSPGAEDHGMAIGVIGGCRVSGGGAESHIGLGIQGSGLPEETVVGRSGDGIEGSRDSDEEGVLISQILEEGRKAQVEADGHPDISKAGSGKERAAAGTKGIRLPIAEAGIIYVKKMDLAVFPKIGSVLENIAGIVDPASFPFRMAAPDEDQIPAFFLQS